jgi:hypothetical protein
MYWATNVNAQRRASQLHDRLELSAPSKTGSPTKPSDPATPTSIG